MIAINDLTYHLGKRTLYDAASLHIKDKDKIGLIGPNGAGKSTLLKIITGELMPDSGKITKPKECSIGFFNQDLLSYQTEDNIRNVAMQAFSEALATQKKIEALCHQMEHNYSDDLLTQLSHLQENFERIGGYDIQSKSEAMLEGMGFATKDLDRSLSEFSGGWRMRVMFAKLLLQQPSVLILDEPTNHLDLVSIKWVEEYLRNYDSAFIVVSHDRSFLDGITTKIVEISNKKFTMYVGNYSNYEIEKTERSESLKNAYTNQQKQMKHAQEFIDRFRAKASKAKLVQSRIKALTRVEQIEPPSANRKTVNFHFPIKQNPSKIIAVIEKIDKSYGPVEILKNTAVEINRGDKIALIGANGRGKTTLLRIIAGQEPAEKQQRNFGNNVDMAFYSQHQLEDLNMHHNILEELAQHSTHAGRERTEQELRTIAAMFLFTKDDVFKKIEILSGGEKARVALAKVLLSQANCLLLDEPTNHLDINSINILGQALQQYEGTCLFVSHDRNFIQQVANKIWFIEDKKVRVFPSNYEAFEATVQLA
ncbi:ABC-F family ATP-binding cassette domain-containing protein [Candidatus Cardinium hertigii]|jgi:ATP-binding cassette subfamily F protein 3|uniref:ABC transporter ATP-binding protein n=1 Tax=Candidatus Cardinium hertigii TaxID=247481 RepID=A0A3N2QBF3_9BACT|nr:ABC-F family ATP-binding cassette domain-containing protein [Candidatus Cardinium hertigii]ROT47156.1 ABC transporter ATP-binding protein [Candidatus Cardinium hertigii]